MAPRINSIKHKDDLLLLKAEFSITDNDIIDKSILPKGDFTVTSSNNSVATVRKETMGGGEWNGFSVFASNAGRFHDHRQDRQRVQIFRCARDQVDRSGDGTYPDS